MSLPDEPPDPGVPSDTGQNSGKSFTQLKHGVLVHRKRGPDDNPVVCNKSPKINSSLDPSPPDSQDPSIASYPAPTPSSAPIRLYTASDPGPFIIHVSKDEDPSTGFSLNPLKFGFFLYKNKISSLCEDGIKKIGRNRLAIHFNSFSSANEFVSLPILASNCYKAFIPSFNVSRMGVVRGIPTDFSDDDIINFVTSPIGFGKVIKMRRFNQKFTNTFNTVEWRPTETVVLTFDGQKLPERVFFMHNSIPVDVYKYPIIQCFKCCRYGHVQTQCRSNPRCFKCSQPHSGNSCKVVDENISCLFCLGRHSAISRDCPEQSRQRNIKCTMSEENISFQEACKKFPSVRRPYSEALISSSSPLSHPPTYAQKVSSSQPLSHSYKKTVFLKPKLRPVSLPGYDKKAHFDIISSAPSHLPNGCALQLSKDNISSDNLPLDSCIKILSSNSPLPSNAASKLDIIYNLLKNHHGSKDPSMEYKKCDSEKT